MKETDMKNVAAGNAGASIYPSGYHCSNCGQWVNNYSTVAHVCWGWSWLWPQTQFLPAPQVGWQCPNCRTGLAPWMPYCTSCAPKKPEPSK